MGLHEDLRSRSCPPHSVNDDGSTHLSTIEAEVRRMANSCDLGQLNTDFFIKSTFVSNLACYVQEKEAEAYKRGLSHTRS